MPGRYYLDTAIWMDYYEDRKDRSRNLRDIAFKLLCKILASHSKILISRFTLMELETFYSLDEIRGIVFPFEKLIEKVEMSEEQIVFAEKVAKERKIPKGDAVHAILARDNNVILISRDKHFHLLKDITVAMKPEEII